MTANYQGALIVTLSDGGTCNFAATSTSGSSVAGTLTRTGRSYAATNVVFTPPPVNTVPSADAGGDQTVSSASTVTLDGSLSSDSDQDPLTYTWTQLSGPTVTLLNASTASPTFTAPTLLTGALPETLVFSLVVNDGIANSTSDSVEITVEAPAATPATEFADAEDEIRAVLSGDAQRGLNSAVTSNRNMVRNARDRLIDQTAPDATNVSNQPLEIDGSFDANPTTISSKGTFFGQAGLTGGKRSLVFGDFDIQRDNETGSNTITLNGKVAWEQSISDKTMLGYFIGGVLAR